MRRLRFAGVMAAASLCGCAGMVPGPSATGAAVGSQSGTACKFDSVDALRATLHHAGAAGMAVPAVILRADGPSSDRVIRNGTRVILRSISDIADQRPPPGSETSPLTIAAVGIGSDPVELHGDGVVQLQSPATSASAPRGASQTPAGEFVIYKADVPDVHRPTSCDSTLRDGDFVYLRTIPPSAWVEVRDGRLVRSTEAPTAGVPCSAVKNECYTDRYGGLLCTSVDACARTSKQ